MGQRLTVTIEKDGEKLLCGYWHWSGYTESSIAVCKAILEGIIQEKEYIENCKNKIQLQMKLINIIRQNTEAKLSFDFDDIGQEEKDLFNALKLYQEFDLKETVGEKDTYYEPGYDRGEKDTYYYEPGYDRNDGLLTPFNKGIERYEYWSEAPCFINLDDMTVNIDGACWKFYNNIEGWLRENLDATVTQDTEFNNIEINPTESNQYADGSVYEARVKLKNGDEHSRLLYKTELEINDRYDLESLSDILEDVNKAMALGIYNLYDGETIMEFIA